MTNGQAKIEEFQKKMARIKKMKFYRTLNVNSEFERVLIALAFCIWFISILHSFAVYFVSQSFWRQNENSAEKWCESKGNLFTTPNIVHKRLSLPPSTAMLLSSYYAL